MPTRRKFLKTTAMAGAASLAPWGGIRNLLAVPAAPWLSDPAFQPKFINLAPNALHPAFMFHPDENGRFNVAIRETRQMTGLVNPSGRPLATTVWGYGDDRGPTWPGRTIQVRSVSAGGPDYTMVRWENQLFGEKHLLPVDTHVHWCYSLHGDSSANGVDYTQFSINKDGVPIITHLHGGNSDFQFDGNPEFFYSPGGNVKGPRWDFVPGGFTNDFVYNNNVPAGNLWYHDHALGITRLNVYAGLAGFYFVRDEFDTGMPDNPLGLPAFPYELAYAIQDRMFKKNGQLFYPAFPSDPFWADFITGEGLANGDVPKPSALAEFFGDHMVVNGVIWPKENVEPRHYRMHLLNGTDSRFMVLQFVSVDAGVTDPNHSSASLPLPFYVIGSDQGLASSATITDTLVIEPGSRYDIVFDFSQVSSGSRVIVKNIGGDAPFGGAFGVDLDPDDVFPDRQTDRIMAFDVVKAFDNSVPDLFDPSAIEFGPGIGAPTATRRVALFEGKDEFGRLQPLLGTVANDLLSATAYTWFQPATETPTLDTTEEWEIYNFTGDAHPIHLHLVNFEILGRNEIAFEADEENPQQVLQHNGTLGTVAAVSNIEVGAAVNLEPADGYVENAPKDLVTALPEQVTRIKATFNKPGRYVWHCHILSHEDHEMMRVLQVIPV